MSRFDELSKQIKTLSDHIKLYPHSASTPLRVARLNFLKKERSELVGNKNR